MDLEETGLKGNPSVAAVVFDRTVKYDGCSVSVPEYYLDEFTFRFNRRTSRHRGKLFSRLIEHAVVIGPSPYEKLIVGPDHNM